MKENICYPANLLTQNMDVLKESCQKIFDW